jgi:hypothetical protein
MRCLGCVTRPHLAADRSTLDVQGHTDVKTLTPIVKRMRERFRLREITVVADRGMVSQATLEASQEERSAGALYRWSVDAPAEGSEHFGTWQPCTLV